ncbi:MAG: cupredoxin domain-containing protein [Candidatus Micrarchaeota archaeon]|nr:cupredoxin domain-containing protein [Candidatus Micrarchaeota archaeon]
MASQNLIIIGIVAVIIIAIGVILYTGSGGYTPTSPSNANGNTTQTTVSPTTIPTNGLTTTTPTTVTTTIGSLNGTSLYVVTEQEYSFSPNVIVVMNNTMVSFKVENLGGTVHNLLFQSGPAASTPPIAPGTNFTITFKAPGPGNYTFYSNARISDRAQGMVGTLVVK